MLPNAGGWNGLDREPWEGESPLPGPMSLDFWPLGALDHQLSECSSQVVLLENQVNKYKSQ